jgi:hypothetical protein
MNVKIPAEFSVQSTKSCELCRWVFCELNVAHGDIFSTNLTHMSSNWIKCGGFANPPHPQGGFADTLKIPAEFSFLMIPQSGNPYVTMAAGVPGLLHSKKFRRNFRRHCSFFIIHCSLR